MFCSLKSNLLLVPDLFCFGSFCQLKGNGSKRKNKVDFFIVFEGLPFGKEKKITDKSFKLDCWFYKWSSATFQENERLSARKGKLAPEVFMWAAWKVDICFFSPYLQGSNSIKQRYCMDFSYLSNILGKVLSKYQMKFMDHCFPGLLSLEYAYAETFIVLEQWHLVWAMMGAKIFLSCFCKLTLKELRKT